MPLDLLLAQAELAKAATDVLHAEDMLSLWKAIAVLGWLCAVAAGVMWQRGKDAELARLNKLLDTYQQAQGGAKGGSL